MHVVLISQCEHRAIARTARVLDAYALRQGDRTWMTPITQEGLKTLNSVLRAGATRQTAVACYVSQGIRQMRLIWTVGKKGVFGPKGEVAVATKRRLSQRQEPVQLAAGLRAAALLARLAGYLHDLGKFGLMFQDKLAGVGPMADAVRHEWLSLHILQTLQKQASGAPLDCLSTGWDDAWKSAALPMGLMRMKDLAGPKAPLSAGLTDPWAALLFLVFTHHRLPGDQAGLAKARLLSDATYIDDDKKPSAAPKLRPVAAPSALTLDLVKKTATRLSALEKELGQDPIFWRAVASVARMGLILADHSISSVDKAADPGHGANLQRQLKDMQTKSAFANTVRGPDGQRAMNQELNWHLQNVGNEASEFVSHFLRFDPPGLSEAVVNELHKPTSGRFAWQGQAAKVLHEAQLLERLPTLVFNVAGTGCGKTRMNVVAAAALREEQGGHGKVRIATALNLRTLTLQTRDAYADQLRMGSEELACVIGSAVAQRLHEARSLEEKQLVSASKKEADEWGVDEDGNPLEEVFEGSGEAEPPPYWLEHFLQLKPKMRAVVMAPVLVCTIDHLIKAGEPTEQGNHALTNLRLMTSDLVLDEIDSYDPKALVAVTRLVTAAGFWGRHVIASSATLSTPVATAVTNAYALGVEMRDKLHGVASAGRFRVAMLDDKCPARSTTLSSLDDFAQWFQSSLQAMLDSFGPTSFRPIELAPISFKNCADAGERKAAVLEAIDQACERMHGRHRWTVLVDGKPHLISLGLVRISNINRAVDVARHLSSSLNEARIACYHSRLPRIARFMLERSLDHLLTRKDASAGPHQAPEIQEAVRQARAAGHSETTFIVVASPVEEIGRDHDFDWAVIEPSSVQSIVQTAGRVNRHRLEATVQPNIAVLQFNFKHALKLGSAICFARPGLEAAGQPYENHDLAALFDWQELERCGQIDARARFNTDLHDFARYDDESTDFQIGRHSNRFLTSDRSFWMGRDTYKEVPLREFSDKRVISQTHDGSYLEEHRDGKSTVWLSTKICPATSLSNGWLAWSFEDLRAEALRLGLSPIEAFAVELDHRPDRPEVYSHSLGLGYFLDK